VDFLVRGRSWEWWCIVNKEYAVGTHAIGAREPRQARGISLFDINNEPGLSRAEKRTSLLSLSPSLPFSLSLSLSRFESL